MLKKLLKENQNLGNRKFGFQNKESYTLSEVRDILDEHARYNVNIYDDIVEEYVSGLTSQTKTELEKLTKLAEERAAKIVEVENSVGDVAKLKSQIAEYEGKVKSYEEELTPFRTEKRKATANELLKGLVASGAELDVYDQLADALKEVEFKEGEDKKKKISPLLTKVFEAKPYLKPVAEHKFDSDETFKQPKVEGEVDDEEVVDVETPRLPRL